MTENQDIKYLPLNQGKLAIIDAEDFERLSKFKWYCGTKGYVARSIHLGMKEGKRITAGERLHRAIMKAQKHEQVDHINGDKLDNRKSNLRLCSNKENCRNRKKRKNSECPYKGVVRHTETQWKASIGYNGKFLYIGVYTDPKEAALAYNKKALELFGDFARLNVIEVSNGSAIRR